MTREDIIRMAREAGFLMREIDLAYGDELKLFAQLVAAAEREQMKKEGWRQCAVGQKTTQFCGMLEQAVAAEREKLNKKIAALEADVDHFFKLGDEYLERANKAVQLLVDEVTAIERERCVSAIREPK